MIIYWDLDETLRENKELTKRAIEAAISKFIPSKNLNLSSDQIYNLWNKANLECIIDKDDKVFARFFKILFPDIDNIDKLAEYAKAYVHNEIEYQKPFDHTEVALQIVQRFKNGIISHAKKGSTIVWLKRYNLEKYFDPNLIFDGVIDKKDYMKGHFIYIGDSISDLYSFLKVETGNMILIGRHDGYVDKLLDLYPEKRQYVYYANDALEASKLVTKLFKKEHILN